MPPESEETFRFQNSEPQGVSGAMLFTYLTRDRMEVQGRKPVKVSKELSSCHADCIKPANPSLPEATPRAWPYVTHTT